MIDISESGAHEFNEILDVLDKEYSSGNINKIVRTSSGGVSITINNFKPPMFDVIETSSPRGVTTGIEITYISDRCCRIQFRRNYLKEKDSGISGRKAYTTAIGIIKDKFGVDIEKYAINNVNEAYEVKKTIPAERIEVSSKLYLNKEWDNMHHIDLNSAFISGMVNEYPDLYEPFKYMYDRRKSKDKDGNVYKAVMVETWGYFQSKYVNYKYSNLSKAGIEYCNNQLEILTKRLYDSGRIPVLYNTDGIWYRGDIYHGDGEGTDLCQWKNDHTNCRMRIKSKGAYEFEELDTATGELKYTPVVRGSTRLDKIKNRKDWVWGDIYNPEAEVINFTFKNGRVYKDGELC